MKIFVQIASYRDPELLPTIRDCINKAKHPENLTFGICRQFHPEDKFDDLSEYNNDNRFRVINVPYLDAKGVCWARNQVQQLYEDEEYTLQIDSHMRFEKNWDETLIGMINQLQEIGIPKPLLTGYVSSYNPQNDPEGRVRVPWRMAFDRFIPEGAVFFLPETIPNWEDIELPVPSRFYSAHFCFTLGIFSKEVQHNPNFYFHGEEISIAVRAFTHGYDLFHPHRVVLWHEYTRNGRTKHWDDDKDWWKLNNSAHNLNRLLFGMDGNEQSGHNGKYGFGTVRTLRDYEIYSGLLFSKRAVQKYTLDKSYPPNPYDFNSEEEWITSFSTIFKHCIDLNLDRAPFDDYDFWVVAFHNSKGDTINRLDLNKDEVKQLQKDTTGVCKIWREFQTTEKPSYWVVWPYSSSKGWCDKIEGKL